jgi:hypothetical protein
MAQTQRAMNLLAKIVGPAVAKAKSRKEIQDLIDGQNGFKFRTLGLNFIPNKFVRPNMI